MEIRYPDLPIVARKDDIAAALRDHQVVVIAGETGSGKTTQLPKICLELGRTMIAHTQPRRLAARTVAERIASELGVELGREVGYSVRFTDRVSRSTRVRVMTDGILLNEITRDRTLRRYDTLIIDEAHERSLNIDFLLGYLTRLLPRRPDLKLIITSATIDPHRFASHFGEAPVIEVSGRTYPVEIRFRPLDPSDDPSTDEDDVVTRIEPRDQVDGILDAVRELPRDGDILVFLSGEREIRDTAEALRGLRLFDTEVLPLYARLSTAEQHRVFEPHAERRIVLATNVAETSLTVPGIKYVIDTGTARISRYSHRTKVQRLPIEPVSQASANQRAGRCGRTSEGICIRLYSKRDFERRPEFTEPEILRTNLAAVLLQMADLGLGDIDDFPFVEPPDRRSVRDGLALLSELGALDADGRLTPVGRQLARLPVDPRIGRMIVEAGRQGCVREVLVLAAALSIPDPRELPTEQLAAAQQKHARFADPDSDFTALLKLWTYLSEQRQERSGNGFRRMCREEFVHYLRVREWQDLVGQLRQIAKDIGLSENGEPADLRRVHAAITAGLLSHVGMRIGESREYQGARSAKFLLVPGSALAKRPPAWVVAAELVETSRLYARINARVQPEQVEKLAGHLVVRTYSEPAWDRGRGAVMARERVTLYGLPLVAGRPVNYGSIDPAVSRELFIRHALVEGDWDTHHEFAAANRGLLADVRELEDRARRRDLLVTEDELHDWFDARVPAEVVSSRHFDTWWKRQQDKRALTLTRADVLRAEPDDEQPAEWHEGDLALPVSYRFAPGEADDGVTVHVPVDVLARLGGGDFGWQVPALREELVTALIRSLPKDLRRHFVPAPDTARAVLAKLQPGAEPLLDGLQRELHAMTGVLVPRDAFDLGKVPAHLRVTFAVEDAHGRVVARGKDLTALQEDLAGQVREAVGATLAAGIERSGLTAWPDLDPIPRVVEQQRGGHLVRGYPGFVDEGKTVALRVLARSAEQDPAMAAGTRRLIRLVVPSPAKGLAGGLGTKARLAMAQQPGGVPAVIEDCVDAAVDAIVARHGGPAWTREAFDALVTSVRAQLVAESRAVVLGAAGVLVAAHELRAALPAQPPPAQSDAITDIRAQLGRLTAPGFVTRAGRERLPHVKRYLEAARRRLERLPFDVAVDRARMERVRAVTEAYESLRRALPPSRATAPDVEDIGWLIEELRVSLFAQQLGTARPVSEQRIYKAIDTIAP